MTTTNRTFTRWMLFGVLAALILVIAALSVAIAPDAVAGARTIIRATARTSFVLFLAAFTASSLATLVPNGFTRGLMRERRYVGLSFAFSHLVHLVAILSYGVLSPEFWPSRSALTNAPGTAGYVFIFLLTVTSFRGVSSRMTPAAWKRLHILGIWVIAAVFGYSFFKRIPAVSVLYVIPFSILCAAIAVRLVGKWAQANKRREARLRNTLPTTLESIS